MTSSSSQRSRRLGEWAAVAQVPRLALRSPVLLARRRAVVSTVLVLPGRGVNDASTAPLRLYLAALGHQVRGWGLGVNDGNIARLSEAVASTAAELAAGSGGQVALVGQSMGGSVAREVARTHPEVISQLITLGTPLLRPLSAEPIRCPVTAIYSRDDRIVPPAWAVDRDPAVDNVEVTSTHFGMGIDPDVWQIVADRLASAGVRAARDGHPTPAV